MMDPHSVDSALVIKIRAGDERAFEVLFKRYCRAMILFANRYLKDIPNSENIVQDVFLNVWNLRGMLDPSKSIKCYLFRSVRNRAISHLRHHRLDPGKVSDTIIFGSPSTPEEEYESKEMEAAVHEAIEALPPACRLIFKMNRFDKLTYSEIAEIQGISLKTVETQMGRALKFIRKVLARLISSALC